MDGQTDRSLAYVYVRAELYSMLKARIAKVGSRLSALPKMSFSLMMEALILSETLVTI